MSKSRIVSKCIAGATIGAVGRNAQKTSREWWQYTKI